MRQDEALTFLSNELLAARMPALLSLPTLIRADERVRTKMTRRESVYAFGLVRMTAIRTVSGDTLASIADD